MAFRGYNNKKEYILGKLETAVVFLLLPLFIMVRYAELITNLVRISLIIALLYCLVKLAGAI